MATSADVLGSGTGHGDRSLTLLLAFVLVAWFGAALILSAAGAFESGPDGRPLPLLAAVVGPPAVFWLLYRGLPRLRAFVLAVDLRLLTAVQSWRVLGAMFLVLYAYDLRPALFAFPAGLGDVAVGVAAVVVLRAMLRRAPGWRRQVLLLNLGGLVDFAVAVAAGVLTTNSALGIFAGPGVDRFASMGLLPLSLIPAFAVPLFIIFHMMSLIQLRRAKEGT